MGTTSAGTALLKSLLAMREQKGNLNIDDVGEMFEKMASSLHPSDVADQFLKDEITKLASYLDSARSEIVSMGKSGGESEDGESRATGDAALHLDAVIKGTEEASNTIMDAADAIQNAAAGIGGDKEKQIMEATNKIYDACNFQDLTGQRVTKVITLLNTLDERIHKIAAMFGAAGAIASGAAPTPNAKGEFDESKLLNGPQLPGKAPSQADIDALFSDFNPPK